MVGIELTDREWEKRYNSVKKLVKEEKICSYDDNNVVKIILLMVKVTVDIDWDWRIYEREVVKTLKVDTRKSVAN